MGSVRRRGGAVRVTLDRAEASLIVTLAAQVSGLLAGGAPSAERDSDDPIAALVAELDAPIPASDDPILGRLLPDAYRDDPGAAGEFRRLTDGDLRATKRAALQRILDDVAEAGGLAAERDLRLDLDEAAASAWLQALTDVRLALGVRLDVREDSVADREGLVPGTPREAELAVYDWLTWLQDAIVRAVSM
jgi:hypothetical protein